MRSAIYCARCFGFRGFGHDSGSSNPEPIWIPLCDWCQEHQPEEQAEPEAFRWRVPRRCEQCGATFLPQLKLQRFCCDRCRARAHRRLKANAA